MFLGLVHVALIFDAIVLIPNIIGKSTGIPLAQIEYITFASIIIAALSTLIQALRWGRIGSGFVLFSGSYSAFVVCSLEAVNMGGLPLLATMGILTVPVIFLYTYFLRFLRHIVTPAVGGIVMMLVAIALIPIALDLWMGGNSSLSSYGSHANLFTGMITLLIIVVLMLIGNSSLRLWIPIIGLVAGYCTASYFGLLNLSHFNHAPLFGLPGGSWPGIFTDLSWHHVPLASVFIIISLISAIEGTGNIMLVQKVSKRNFHKIEYERIQGGLYCDGFAKLLAGITGTAPVATYCDNIPLLEMTGVSSRLVGVYGAGILFSLAFMPKISGFILDMPSPVIGGILVVISAMIFYAGISLVQSSGLNFQKGFIMGLSLCAGLIAESGIFFPDLMPAPLAPLLGNSVAMGGLTAFFLNWLVYVMPQKKLVFTLLPSRENIEELMQILEKGIEKLRLSDKEYALLQLACEETFLHMVAFEKDAGDIIFKILRDDEEVFVEIISSVHIDDVDQVVRPPRSLNANQEEISNLGLVILQKMVKELRHIRISGHTYISFFIPA